MNGPWDDYKEQAGPWLDYSADEQVGDRGGPFRRYSAKGKKGFTFGEVAENIPESALRYGKDIWNTVRHPIDTINAMGQLGAGAIQLAIPGEQGNEEAARSVGRFYRDRYGGADEFLNTLERDPVGVLSDASGVLTGAAAVLPKSLSVVGKIGAAIDPVNVVTKPVRAVAKAVIPKSLPENMTMGAAKFGTTYTPAERRTMARTMLDEGILPNEKGYDRLVKAQQDVGLQIDALIDRAAATGQKVPVTALTTELPKLVQKAAGPTLSSADDLQDIFRVVNDYVTEMQRRGITELDARQLQDFKTNAYERINWGKLYNPQSLTPMREQASARMARAARQEIEGMVPEITDVNARYGRLAELREPLGRAVNRIDNRDMVGIGVPLKMAAGAAVGDMPGGFLGGLAGAVDAPLQKARLARGLELLRTNPVLSKSDQYMALLRQLAAEAGAMTSLLGPSPAPNIWER